MLKLDRVRIESGLRWILVIESTAVKAMVWCGASAWIKSYVKMGALGIGVQRQSRLVAGVGTLEFIATTVASFRTSRDGGSVMQKLESVTRRCLGLPAGRSVADEPPQGFFRVYGAVR